MSEQIAILIQIILIDLVLAADNAIIIGMLASKFDQKVRKKIFFWGISAAVILRIIFTLLTAYLLQIDGLKLIGGLILLWVVYKLYKDVVKNNEKQKIKFSTKKKSLLAAIGTIALADISLSLDNVLGVAGAAKHHYELLIFGLVLSIILMATMANVVSKMITKYTWIAWLGLFAILYVAIDLIYTDLKILI
ncbi:MAG: YjbE family putative metal transport protein [Pelagibacteraceae bacterium]|jgi:YjbE family integral membrane protein|tara:strand:- start:50 stop:625 length:576 start_codon:yes stop_codon:yes gene_type:complete